MAFLARKIRSQEEDPAALALEALPAATMILEASGRVLFASVEASGILGDPVDSVAADPVPSDDFPRQEIFRLLREACGSGAEMNRLVTLDGRSRRYFQVCAAPIPGGGGTGRTAVLIQELTGLVAQGDMAKEFVRQVRHDLRGPLTSMRGAVDLLLTGRLGPLEEKQKNLLHLVEKATRQMTAMVSGSAGSAERAEDETAGSGGR
jgi:signal transduction histidine kinase